MLTRTRNLILFIVFCAIVWLGTNAALAQTSVADFHNILREKLAFDETDLAAMQQGQTVVKLLPVQDKREVAVSGLVSLKVPAEVFLQSYRESMFRKSNPAILEIGKFSSQPTMEDLKDLTLEDRDVEDLKNCVVGDCQLKLSASMIERFHKEVDWEKPDYRNQATHLLKVMLLGYVRDYLARGDVALIEYNDKAKIVRLAEEQRALKHGSSHIYEVLNKFSQHRQGSPEPKLANVENAIVWSKIKLGLKPVTAINHITIYRSENEGGPVLIASKQIYANHYFNSSVGLTAFVNIPGDVSGSYLIYENRSRADGLEGMFGKIKRGIVEDKAVDGLRVILEQSRANLTARMLTRTESAPSTDGGRGWKRWTAGRVRMLFVLSLITMLAALLALGNYNWKGAINGGAHH